MGSSSVNINGVYASFSKYGSWTDPRTQCRLDESGLPLTYY